MGYHEGSRELQDRFDTRRLADRLDERLVHVVLTDDDRAFIEARDMFFLATADAEGRPTCSYKGGDPGFLRVLDPRTVAFPSYDGNGMFFSLGNVLVNPHVGLLLVDFTSDTPFRMRLEGVATVSGEDDPLCSAGPGDTGSGVLWPEAQCVVRVQVQRVFPNCPRYVHRMTLSERSEFVPRQDRPTPVPDWKRSPLAADVLPAGDPASRS